MRSQNGQECILGDSDFETSLGGINSFKKLIRFREFGVLIGLVILLVFFSFTARYFLSWANLINVARQVSMIAIMAFGMTVVVVAGGIDLSVGSVMGVSGVFTATLMMQYNVPIFFCMIAGIFMGGLLGLFNGLLNGFFKIPSFIATLAMLNIARGIALLYTDAKPIYNLPDSFTVLGTGYMGPIPIPVILMLIMFATFYFLMGYTKIGRYAYSIGGNADVARLSGINVRRYSISFFAISGLMAGLAGVILTARMASGEPTSGAGYELDVIAAVVLGGTSLSGGKGTMLGTLIGAFIMGVLDNGLAMLNVPPFVQMICSGLVIVLAVGVNMRKSKEIVK